MQHAKPCVWRAWVNREIVSPVREIHTLDSISGARKRIRSTFWGGRYEDSEIIRE